MHKGRILILILAVTFISFSASLNNEFTNWDDDFHLTENFVVQSIDFENIVHIFKNSVQSTYIPLTIFSFALEYHFFKLNPFIYHLNNLLLHLGVVTLIYLFSLRMGLAPLAAGLGALLFGIHPMHVESVAWVTERKDVLYAFFYMMALCTYMNYLEGKQKRFYLLTLFFGLLSILAKPMALSLPLVLLVCDWFKKKKLTLKVFLEKVPFILYIIPITWITYSLNARMPGESIQEALILWIWSFSFYIQKFFLPINLNPFYLWPEPIGITHLPYLGSLMVFLLCMLLLYIFRKQRWYVFALVFYFFSIFFLLRFDKGAEPQIVADRYMYMPSVGFCLLFGYLAAAGLNRLREKGGLVKQIGAVCLAFFIFGIVNKDICSVSGVAKQLNVME